VRRFRANAAPLLAYTAVAFVYVGWPVVQHPGRLEIGHSTDPDIYVWSFGWWAHALTHGQNPLVTHAVWAPQGLDLAWSTTAQGLALLFAPLTLAVGPVAAYNVACVALAGVGAWTAFLLCRYVTGATWPALAGGYLFGFSSYALAQQGHLPIAAVFPLPLVALVVLRYLDGRSSGRALSLRLGVLVGAQLWFSIEIAATLVLALLLGLALAFWVAPATRVRIRGIVSPLAGAAAVAAALTAPLLYYLLTDFRSAVINIPQAYVSDLANFAVPTRIAELGGSWAGSLSDRFPGNAFEQDAYLGLPALVILGLFLGPRLRQPLGRFLAAAIGLTAIASLGQTLHVAGHRLIALPWRLLTTVPVLDNVLPARLIVYATLAAAVAVALWAARSGAALWLRVLLPALAVLALVPNLGLSSWSRAPSLPQFFGAGYSSGCIREGDNVLLIPWGYTGDALFWQAASGFHFRIAGGALGAPIPSTFTGTIVSRLFNDHAHSGDGPDIVAFARSKGVSTIVVDPADPQPWSSLLLAAYGPPTKTIGGVLLYEISPGLIHDPACASR
jgi:hypothetical protein